MDQMNFSRLRGTHGCCAIEGLKIRNGVRHKRSVIERRAVLFSMMRL